MRNWTITQHQRELAVDRHLAMAQDFNRELQKLDPHLSLVWAKPGSEEVGLIPDRWHIHRENEAGPDTFMVITGPNGEYREPDSAVLDEVRKRDLWSAQGVRAAEKAQREKRQSAERERERKRQERRDEIADRAELSERVSIRVPGSKK